MTTQDSKPAEFHRKDIAEIAMGACIMAFPVATAQEVWDLGTELSAMRVLFFALASLFFLGLVVYVLFHRAGIALNRKVFLQRVIYTYGFTLLIAALLLFAIDRIDFLDEPWVSLKRIILVAFPASFAATAVDSLR